MHLLTARIHSGMQVIRDRSSFVIHKGSNTKRRVRLENVTKSGGLRQKERSLLAFVWAPTTFLYPHCPSYWPPEALDYVFDMSVHLRVRTLVPG